MRINVVVELCLSSYFFISIILKNKANYSLTFYSTSCSIIMPQPVKKGDNVELNEVLFCNLNVTYI